MDENNYERNGERDLASVLEQKEYLHVAYSKERLTSGSVPQPLLAHLGKRRSSLAHMNKYQLSGPPQNMYQETVGSR